jgi:two-component system sensor histidine kinase TctE
MRAIVRSIAGTTDSAVHLANRLLTLARIEHGSETFDAFEPVSLPAIVRHVGLELALPAVDKEIDLALEAPDEALVPGQALMLHELASNLVDNAIRYTPRGGTVLLRVRVQAGSVVLEVQDSGPGIPEAEREKVFTPFYRMVATMEANPSGTGLGLAIVRDIAALHKADLVLDRADGATGLKITVTFPAYIEESAELS